MMQIKDLKLFQEALDIVNCESGRIFARECGINDSLVFFSGEIIQVLAPTKKRAKEFWQNKREILTQRCLAWQQDQVDIGWGDGSRALSIYAKPIDRQSRNLGFSSKRQLVEKQLRNLFMEMGLSTEPLIAIPSIEGIEIGDITLTPEVLERVNWMVKNPTLVSGITRVHDERQVIMSAISQEKLLTTTTLKQAVQRRRSEYWHPYDLMEFRFKTWEWVRDLRNGSATPEATQKDIAWRCVSRNGTWRLITHKYETFIDRYKNVYQLSQNVDIKPIDPPNDIILARA